MEIDVIEAVVVLFRADRYITPLPMRPACVSTPKRPLRCAQLLILQSVELAEAAKKAAETAFEECSDVARHEIKAFQKQRVQEMRLNLTQLARSELARARSIRASLQRALDQARLFPVPDDPHLSSLYS
ncbi:hypothetical protein OUZ56_030838 [Daphnia magna]|uniref:Uncharacterized protein n=1 Tax=Daphnia magna TaxID=35525 RepID=A0ABQ9ZSH6_9CRUS|nr:hypothetical protein OUZ56_030838 [Daphnia magna]